MNNKTELLLNSLFTWLEENKNNESYVSINFSGVFCHYFRNIMKDRVPYFKYKYIKPRWLSYVLEGNKLLHLKLTYPDFIFHTINDEIVEILNNKKPILINEDFYLPIIKENKEILLDLHTVENFIF
jgi:hypothetical protein